MNTFVEIYFSGIFHQKTKERKIVPKVSKVIRAHAACSAVLKNIEKKKLSANIHFIKNTSSPAKIVDILFANTIYTCNRSRVLKKRINKLTEEKKIVS